MHPCGFLQAEQKDLLYSAYFVACGLCALAVIPLYGTFITSLFKVCSNQVGTVYSPTNMKRVQAKKLVFGYWERQIRNQRFLLKLLQHFFFTCLTAVLRQLSPFFHFACHIWPKPRTGSYLLLLEALPDFTVVFLCFKSDINKGWKLWSIAKLEQSQGAWLWWCKVGAVLSLLEQLWAWWVQSYCTNKYISFPTVVL